MSIITRISSAENPATQTVLLNISKILLRFLTEKTKEFRRKKYGFFVSLHDWIYSLIQVWTCSYIILYFLGPIGHDIEQSCDATWKGM